VALLGAHLSYSFLNPLRWIFGTPLRVAGIANRKPLAAADQASGGVQEAVAQGLGLGAGELAVQGDEPQPGETPGRTGRRSGLRIRPVGACHAPTCMMLVHEGCPVSSSQRRTARAVTTEQA
jgi:hypothetical protein